MSATLCEPLFSLLSDFYIYLALFINDVSSVPLRVFLAVTLTAHKSQVLEVESDVWVVDVLWCEWLNVMHDLSRSVKTFCKTVLA